jgi:hypothetical protein
MPVDLHQRLSEFSYGYGVTREVEQLLASVGIHSTPFMPNLLDEKKLAFDAGFEKPGAALLLQFKLGEALQRFRRTNLSVPAPRLRKPFWRFNVNTAERNGQYDLLLKAEQAGAEVYYVAPRFTTWSRYASLFQDRRVLRRSLLLPPSQIEAKLRAKREPDGWHRIVYDRKRVHVLSEPQEVEAVEAQGLPSLIRTQIEQRGESLREALHRVYSSLGRRREIRRGDGGQPSDVEYAAELASSPRRLASDRLRRLESFRGIAATESDAEFAALGVEAWAAGSQLVAITLEK